MKYYKLNYDANRPSVKQVSVPDNSDFGVAVKMYKNDMPTGGLVTIGDLSGEAGPDGYSLFELSSGDTGMYSLDVEVEAAPTTKVEVTDEPFTDSGSVPFGIVTINVYLPYFKDIPELSGLTEIKASDVKNFTASGTFTQGETVSEFNKQDFKLYTGSSENYYLSPDGKGWIKSASTPPVESLPVTSGTRIRVMSIGTATGAWAVDGNWSLKLDSGDGFNTNFNLQVCVSDKGYIEVKK